MKKTRAVPATHVLRDFFTFNFADIICCLIVN